jgi:hypothetical protein
MTKKKEELLNTSADDPELGIRFHSPIPQREEETTVDSGVVAQREDQRTIGDDAIDE